MLSALRTYIRSLRATLALSALVLATSLLAQEAKNLDGVVRDPLGALVANATVELLQGGKVAGATATAADGSFHFALPASGRYALRVAAPGFQPTATPARYFSGSGKVELTLATQTLTQEITVTATGTPLPEAQTGASITVLPHEDFALMLDIQEPLRLVPGLQVTQSGQIGGTTGVSIRGGETTANKVLIDGVPANTIGGGVEFANLATVGVQTIEVLREPNSALYGSDALAGVIALTSTRASTRLPLVTYAGDAGNFHTYRNEVTAGTVYRQFDLYSAFARVDTHNNQPNSEFHNSTYAGNFGWAPNAANDLRFTVRHIVTAAGNPNALAFYGLADSAQAREHDDYYGAAWNGLTTPKWHNQIRYGGLRLNDSINSFGTAGIPDGAGSYDGKVVTIQGANGYTVTGQAYLRYGNASTHYLIPTSRDFVYAQTDFKLNPHLTALGGFKYEDERGTSDFSTSTSPSRIQRGNYSYTALFAGDLRNRLFYQLGTGLENNGLFGFAGTPRASLAYYLVRPSGAGFFSGTKLHGSFGKGIKEPSIFQQNNGLNGLLGPETSRTYDAGVDQQLGNGRARMGVTYFHNQFTNDFQYLSISALRGLGYTGTQLAAFPYGAYVNALSFRSQGAELELEAKLGSHLFARGGYTYTNAVVENSFTTANFNKSGDFAAVPIGAYAPLPGARPFRVAPHTGYFGLNYTRSKLYVSLTGTMVSRRDDSTYLSDAKFGTSLLLPNRNLLGSYQRIELGGGYQVTPRINIYTNIENLASEHYYEAFGYPALPLTFRSGLKVNFGGESWRLK